MTNLYMKKKKEKKTKNEIENDCKNNLRSK